MKVPRVTVSTVQPGPTIEPRSQDGVHPRREPDEFTGVSYHRSKGVSFVGLSLFCRNGKYWVVSFSSYSKRNLREPCPQCFSQIYVHLLYIWNGEFPPNSRKCTILLVCLTLYMTVFVETVFFFFVFC